MLLAGSVVTLRFSICLSVRLSHSGEAWGRVNGVAAGWFDLAGLLASSLRKEAKQWQYYRQ